MNIIEAIKSGKRLKRRGWDDYIFIDDAYFLKNPESLKKEFLLADDWEVEVLPVLVTQEDFQAAWQRAVKKAGGTDIVYNGFCQFSYLVAKELGL